MSMIHWIGAGLSSGPGIRRLGRTGRQMTLWNRTVQKAKDVFSDGAPPNVQIKEFTFDAIAEAATEGDILVSMLPANFHPQLAKLCLEKKAHLVTTSYVSPEMREFHTQAEAAGLSFVNEAGLDPGIDHLFARELYWQFQESPEFDSKAELDFHSYCGGFPEHPGEFCYKFSWSPVGVLRALKSPVKYLREGSPVENAKPWMELSDFDFNGETFQVYPNRDSVPYVEEYGFQNQPISYFMRGTLRPNGWVQAWKPVLDQLETATPEELERISNELWTSYAYGPEEKDRVVLYVAIEAKKDGKTVWKKSLSLDEMGSGKDTAMGRLVSLPATFAVEMIADGRAPRGVSAATENRQEVQAWFKSLRDEEVELR